MSDMNWKPIAEKLTGVGKLLWGQKAMRVICGIAFGVLALTFMKGCHTEKQAAEYKSQLELWQQAARTVMTENAAVKKTTDSISKQSVLQEKRADSMSTVISRLHAQQTTIRKTHDSTLTVLTQILPDTCQAALDLAVQYRSEADSLQRAVVLGDTRDSVRAAEIGSLKYNNGILALSNAALAKILNTVPVYTPPKILGLIPLPSRTQSFWTGYGLGIVTVGAGIFLLHK